MINSHVRVSLVFSLSSCIQLVVYNFNLYKRQVIKYASMRFDKKLDQYNTKYSGYYFETEARTSKYKSINV